MSEIILQTMLRIEKKLYIFHPMYADYKLYPFLKINISPILLLVEYLLLILRLYRG